jgi:protein-ribulosamine 3-kinase
MVLCLGLKQRKYHFAHAMHAIRSALQALASDPSHLLRTATLPGGSIHRTFRVETSMDRYVAKITENKSLPFLFELEQKGLSALQSSKTWRVPHCFGVHYVDGEVVLLMEFVEPGHPNEDSHELLGQAIAALHACTQNQFGLDVDNYIATIPQYNDSFDDWPTFFITQRLDPLLELAMSRGVLQQQDAKRFGGLYKGMDKFFPKEKPSLLHGDLWSGNYFFDSGGVPCVFDPAVYYGHRYMDLGMMALFGGFDPKVMEAYRAIVPLSKDAEEGMAIAQLYPLLVHAILFGSSYTSSIRRVLDRFV